VRLVPGWMMVTVAEARSSGSWKHVGVLTPPAQNVTVLFRPVSNPDAVAVFVTDELAVVITCAQVNTHVSPGDSVLSLLPGSSLPRTSGEHLSSVTETCVSASRPSFVSR